MDFELVLATVAVSALILMTVLWMVFLFYSVRRIEKGIVSENKPRPWQWDPMGWRAFFYAWTVALPARFFNEVDDRALNTEDVKRYSTKTDRVIALLFMIASHTVLLSVIVAWVAGI